MSDPQNRDRRSALRYQFELPVALRLLRDPTLRLASRSRDISAGGIFLYCNAPPPLGEEVAITFKLPRQGATTRLLGVGRVIRVEEDSQDFGLAVTIERCELF